MPRWRAAVRRLRRTSLPEPAISGFIVMRSHLVWLMPGLTQGPPWWHARLSAMMDSGMTVSGGLAHIIEWHLLPPFGSSKILLISFLGQHPVPYQDPPGVRQLIQVVIVLSGQGGWFSSVVPEHFDEPSFLSRVYAEAEQSSRLCLRFQQQLVGSPFSHGMKVVAVVLVAQLWPTLCDPVDCSLPGFSLCRILQARILE